MITLTKLGETIDIDESLEIWLLDNCADDTLEIRTVWFDTLVEVYNLDSQIEILGCNKIPLGFIKLIHKETVVQKGKRVFKRDGFDFILD